MSNDKMVDAIFDQFKDKQELIEALQRAAEEMYENQMVDTNMAVHEITEVAGAYKYYENDEERERAIQNCSYETKQEWIENKIQEWLDPTLGW